MKLLGVELNLRNDHGLRSQEPEKKIIAPEVGKSGFNKSGFGKSYCSEASFQAPEIFQDSLVLDLDKVAKGSLADCCLSPKQCTHPDFVSTPPLTSSSGRVARSSSVVKTANQQAGVTPNFWKLGFWLLTSVLTVSAEDPARGAKNSTKPLDLCIFQITPENYPQSFSLLKQHRGYRKTLALENFGFLYRLVYVPHFSLQIPGKYPTKNDDEMMFPWNIALYALKSKFSAVANLLKTCHPRLLTNSPSPETITLCPIDVQVAEAKMVEMNQISRAYVAKLKQLFLKLNKIFKLSKEEIDVLADNPSRDLEEQCMDYLKRYKQYTTEVSFKFHEHIVKTLQQLADVPLTNFSLNVKFELPEELSHLEDDESSSPPASASQFRAVIAEKDYLDPIYPFCQEVQFSPTEAEFWSKQILDKFTEEQFLGFCMLVTKVSLGERYVLFKHREEVEEQLKPYSAYVRKYGQVYRSSGNVYKWLEVGMTLALAGVLYKIVKQIKRNLEQ